jgi:hypothetical protein
MAIQRWPWRDAPKEVGTMISYRMELLHSWVHEEASVRGLATLLDVAAPFGLRALLDRLRAIETVTVEHAIHTDDGAPLNGHVRFDLRSDGSYLFSGHMRATGLPSYHFVVQPWVSAPEGAVIAAQKEGRVFGTDTPGDRQRNWSEGGVNRGILLRWRSLRRSHGIGYHLHANIAGVIGTARDVLLFAVKGIALSAAIGPTGWFVLVGNELAGLDAQLASPDILAGIAVGAGTLLILGPFGLVPAIVAGAATVAQADIRHRSMNAKERAFADRVFRGKIDFNKVVLTNLSHDNGRKFTIPSIGGVILVNLDDAYDDPVIYQSRDQDYPEPGSVFIHELTHAWQIYNNSFLGVICGLDSNYDYFDVRGRLGDTAWPRRAWSTFNNEQQAHIVDDWYGAHVMRNPSDGSYVFDAQGVPLTDLDGFLAINDPAFSFIRDHIRTGAS